MVLLTNFSHRSSLYSLGADLTENDNPKSSSIVARLFVAAEKYLPHRCPETAASSRITIPALAVMLKIH
jgi:hypothetical protein